MKIALWKIGALGDVLMTTALVRQLRGNLPNAQLDYLVGRSSAVILEGNSNLDHVVTFDESVLYRRKWWKLLSMIRLLRGYDVIYVLDKHWIFHVLAWISRVPIRVGFVRSKVSGIFSTHLVRYGALRHEIDYYLDLLAAAGLQVNVSDRHMQLPDHPGDDNHFDLPTSYVVVVNSGGANAYETSAVRCLPERLLSSLVELLEKDQAVVFLGSAGESRNYAQYCSDRVINLCGKTSLVQAWSVMRRAEVVVTTDTGLMHMAGAVGASLLAVFGPTHPLRKCPPGGRWLWADAASYDQRYEVDGRIPTGTYFREITAEMIVQECNIDREAATHL